MTPVPIARMTSWLRYRRSVLRSAWVDKNLAYVWRLSEHDFGAGGKEFRKEVLNLRVGFKDIVGSPENGVEFL